MNRRWKYVAHEQSRPFIEQLVGAEETARMIADGELTLQSGDPYVEIFGAAEIDPRFGDQPRSHVHSLTVPTGAFMSSKALRWAQQNCAYLLRDTLNIHSRVA